MFILRTATLHGFYPVRKKDGELNAQPKVSCLAEIRLCNRKNKTEMFRKNAASVPLDPYF